MDDVRKIQGREDIQSELWFKNVDLAYTTVIKNRLDMLENRGLETS